jgi:hypothetical protein
MGANVNRRRDHDPAPTLFEARMAVDDRGFKGAVR